MYLHLIKRDGGTSPMKSHQPIKLGGNARSIRYFFVVFLFRC